MGGRGQLSNPNRRVCISMPRDTYSGPGGADDMRAEPSTGRVVGLKATLSWQHLVGVTFFAACGGAYGIEDGARLHIVEAKGRSTLPPHERAAESYSTAESYTKCIRCMKRGIKQLAEALDEASL